MWPCLKTEIWIWEYYVSNPCLLWQDITDLKFTFYRLHAFFINNAFFQFSLRVAEHYMKLGSGVLMCCLLDITIIILRDILCLVYLYLCFRLVLCMPHLYYPFFTFNLIFIIISQIISLKQTLAFCTYLKSVSY